MRASREAAKAQAPAAGFERGVGDASSAAAWGQQSMSIHSSPPPHGTRSLFRAKCQAHTPRPPLRNSQPTRNTSSQPSTLLRHTQLPANLSESFSSVLNLPKTASDHEIRERYRQLSIVFHPDKQTDERRKEAATERFLEVQKAYEGQCPLSLRTRCTSSSPLSSPIRPGHAVRFPFRLRHLPRLMHMPPSVARTIS